MSKNGENDRKPGAASGVPRLDRLVDLARAALFWEQLWRALVPPLLVIGFFVAVSFAGLWIEVGAIWRMIGVGFFATALVISLVPLFALGKPSRKEALSRIDRESGLAHRPASTLDDALANASDDPTTQALWSLHRQRMARNVDSLRAPLPSPRVVDLDRYALRAFVLVALIASAFIAGPEKYARVVGAFDWRGAAAADGAGYRVDAWIDPPAYTGKPPVLLKLAGANADHPEKIIVPIGSTVIVRSSGGDLGLDMSGGLQNPKPTSSDAKDGDAAKKDAASPGGGAKPAASSAPTQDPNEHRLLLRGDGRLAIKHAGATLGVFDLIVIPDKPPRIELTDAPRPNLRGSLTLSYKIEDDYGVVSAAAEFSDPRVEGAKGNLRSLVAPPRVALALPPGPGGLGETETTIDLSDHAWAGARVKLVLTTRDEAGNEGKSEPIFVTLPEKHFVKPLAHALAEQRRNLILYPDEKDLVEVALESLVIAPEAFNTTNGVYLGLRIASRMIQDARSDKDLIAAADFLWEMALQIENGDLSEAERDLRAAEQQLREALQRGASESEIRKLTENLRAAMEKFLNEFAKQQSRERNAQQQTPQGQNGAKSVTRKDLQAMLDRMQEMARAGDRASAQQMLEQLQNMLDNLETAQHQQGDQGGQEMSRALNELDKLMREQQSLRDKTHQQGQKGQGQQGQGQQGQQDQDADGLSPGQQGQQGQDQGQGQGQQQGQGQGQGQGMGGQGEALRQQQQALRQRLEQLQKQLRQRGQGEQGLDDARRAMEEAERGLSKGGQTGNGAAVDAQGRALEAMRKGADQLAQQMMGQGEGQGEGSTQSQQEGGTDPLGRPMGGDSAFNPNSHYDPLGLPAAQRAQRVLEELRKRLSDPFRGREEMDYLERLLHGY